MQTNIIRYTQIPYSREKNTTNQVLVLPIQERLDGTKYSTLNWKESDSRRKGAEEQHACFLSKRIQVNSVRGTPLDNRWICRRYTDRAIYCTRRRKSAIFHFPPTKNNPNNHKTINSTCVEENSSVKTPAFYYTTEYWLNMPSLIRSAVGDALNLIIIIFLTVEFTLCSVSFM